MVAAPGRSPGQPRALCQARRAATARHLAESRRAALESASRHFAETAAGAVASGRTAFERTGAAFYRAAQKPIQRFGIETSIARSGAGPGARLLDYHGRTVWQS